MPERCLTSLGILAVGVVVCRCCPRTLKSSQLGGREVWVEVKFVGLAETASLRQSDRKSEFELAQGHVLEEGVFQSATFHDWRGAAQFPT